MFWLFSHVRDHFLSSVNNGNSLIKTERKKMVVRILFMLGTFRAVLGLKGPRPQGDLL